MTVLHAALPWDDVPVVTATACLVPFLHDPAAALARHHPWPNAGAFFGSCCGVLARPTCVLCCVNPLAPVRLCIVQAYACVDGPP